HPRRPPSKLRTSVSDEASPLWRKAPMKAAVLYEPRKPLVIEDLKLAPPKAGEVRVKVAANGACHSDLHVMTGDMRMPLPLVLGHEGAGIVAETGAGVTSVKE